MVPFQLCGRKQEERLVSPLLPFSFLSVMTLKMEADETTGAVVSEKTMNETPPQFFVVFATIYSELRKTMPSLHAVSFGILITSTEGKLDEEWLEPMATWERANTVNEVLCVFRLNDMDWSPPPHPTKLMNGEKFNAGAELHIDSFFGRSRPWKTYQIRDY